MVAQPGHEAEAQQVPIGLSCFRCFTDRLLSLATVGADGSNEPARASGIGFSLPPIGRAAPSGLKGAAGSKSRVVSGAPRRRTLGSRSNSRCNSRGNSASGGAQRLKYLQSVRLAGQW